MAPSIRPGVTKAFAPSPLPRPAPSISEKRSHAATPGLTRRNKTRGDTFGAKAKKTGPGFGGGLQSAAQPYHGVGD